MTGHSPVFKVNYFADEWAILENMLVFQITLWLGNFQVVPPALPIDHYYGFIKPIHSRSKQPFLKVSYEENLKVSFPRTYINYSPYYRLYIASWICRLEPISGFAPSPWQHIDLNIFRFRSVNLHKFSAKLSPTGQRNAKLTIIVVHIFGYYLPSDSNHGQWMGR